MFIDKYPPYHFPFPYLPEAQNYCPTCGKPWFGGWYQPCQPIVTCKTDKEAAVKLATKPQFRTYV